jgi:Tol biopolymer transport system component
MLHSLAARFARLSLLALFLQTSLHAAVPPPRAIPVTEGTNMQVTVSPDGRQLLANIQGLIYAMPAAGGAAKQITQPLQEASHPDWSAKAGLVAIQSYAGGAFHIWTMKPDGTGLKQVTFGHGDDREPRFSPNGKTIAFTSDRAFEGSYDIWTVEVATGNLKRITSAPDDEFGPNWTPDGTQLAFISGAGSVGREIKLVDVTSGKQSTLVSIAPTKGTLEAPSFSPDGRKLAYVRFDLAEGPAGRPAMLNAAHLIVIPATGGEALYEGKAMDTFPFPAVWRSSAELYYTGDGKILKTNILNGTETAVNFTAPIPTSKPTYTPKKYDFDSTAAHSIKGIYAPALSPDGKSVAFVALNQVYVMPLDGKPVAITHDAFYKQGPAWSPDGKQLAYVSDCDGIENVYLHDMSAAAEAVDKRAFPSASAQIMPAWSPDGKLIAFQDQTMATMVGDLATKKIRLLAPATFFPGRAAFAPNGETVAIATIKPYTRRFREGTSSIVTVDLATGRQETFAPAPFESVTTRTEDGPIYSPDGKSMAFVMDDLLYAMDVDATGHPTGKAYALNNETTDAVTFSADSNKILYLHNGDLRLLDRATKTTTTIPVDLTFAQAKPTQKLLIHAGRFWKGEGAQELTDVDILITDNRITSVTPHSAPQPAGETRVIDASHETVLPGLWENHAHPDSDNGIYYGARMGRLWLAYGITELKGLADNAYRAVEHREMYQANLAPGPRLFNTGEAVDGERVYYPMMIPTTSEAQLQREFDRLKALDFDFVKLYVRLPFAWAQKGAAFGHDQMGVQSGGHYLLPEVDLGEDGMSHISATSRWGWAYSRSLVGRSYQDVDKLLVDSGMWVISTTFSQAPYKDDPGMANDPRQAIAPPWENKRLQVAVDGAASVDQTAALQHLKDEEVTVAEDFRKGGLVLAGTDSPLDIPATSLHANLRAQVKFGLEPWQALETATYLPAKAYGLTKDLGTLEPGKLADLIITSGDPLKNIDDVIKVQCVMKNGFLWSVSDIAAPFARISAGTDICPAQ